MGIDLHPTSFCAESYPIGISVILTCNEREIRIISEGHCSNPEDVGNAEDNVRLVELDIHIKIPKVFIQLKKNTTKICYLF